MTQPLSKVNPAASVISGTGLRVLEQRQTLAVLAMQAIASNSEVEYWLLQLFVQLLGGDGPLAV